MVERCTQKTHHSEFCTFSKPTERVWVGKEVERGVRAIEMGVGDNDYEGYLITREQECGAVH